VARKKKEMTLESLKEEGSGTLIPDNENFGSKEADTSSSMGKSEKDKPQRGRPKRRRGAPFKQTLDLILNTVISPNTVAEAVKATPLGDKITYQEAILIAQVLKASNGDTQAAVFLRDTSGNKLKELKDSGFDVKSFEDF
jgi:hypothetical protein